MESYWICETAASSTARQTHDLKQRESAGFSVRQLYFNGVGKFNWGNLLRTILSHLSKREIDDKVATKQHHQGSHRSMNIKYLYWSVWAVMIIIWRLTSADGTDSDEQKKRDELDAESGIRWKLPCAVVGIIVIGVCISGACDKNGCVCCKRKLRNTLPWITNIGEMNCNLNTHQLKHWLIVPLNIALFTLNAFKLLTCSCWSYEMFDCSIRWKP